jgi:hypothetical protein
MLGDAVIAMDGPDHTRLRRLAARSRHVHRFGICGDGTTSVSVGDTGMAAATEASHR